MNGSMQLSKKKEGEAWLNGSQDCASMEAWLNGSKQLTRGLVEWHGAALNMAERSLHVAWVNGTKLL